MQFRVKNYDLAETGPVRFNIYSMRGQLIRQLVDMEQPAGKYKVLWDAKDDNGMQVGNGIYICQLSAGSFRAFKKITFLK